MDLHDSVAGFPASVSTKDPPSPRVLSLHVALLSGRKCLVTNLCGTTPIYELRRRVEGQLQLRIKALVFDGVLRTTWTMDEAHLQDGDSVTALVAPTLAQPTRHLRAFAALRRDGQVVAWGDPLSGGLGGLPGGTFAARAVRSSHAAFAAIGRDGSVVTWGSPHAGGDSHQVQDQLHDVVDVFSTHSAFCALKRDGSVVTWGAWYAGGDS
ncbi:unnamed protein product, partial [Durusdinium trenchii]